MNALEDGKTKDPKPEVLRSLAALYDLSYEELVLRVAQTKYGVNLTPGPLAELMQARFGGDSLKDDAERDCIERWRATTQQGQELALIVMDYLRGDLPEAPRIRRSRRATSESESG